VSSKALIRSLRVFLLSFDFISAIGSKGRVLSMLKDGAKKRKRGEIDRKTYDTKVSLSDDPAGGSSHAA